jgi:hypothetical protein
LEAFQKIPHLYLSFRLWILHARVISIFNNEQKSNWEQRQNRIASGGNCVITGLPRAERAVALRALLFTEQREFSIVLDAANAELSAGSS